LNNFPTLVSPPNDRSNLSIEHQKNILNQNPSVNIYNTNNHYEPLTPQTLPFDTYPSQNNSKAINQILPPATNVLMNTPQTPLTYSSNSINKSSSSTLVNLLHQKRPILVDQPIPQEKQTTSVKQTRKSPQKKTENKRLSTLNNLQVNSNQTYFY
jgi:hypothetical protein